MEEDLGDVEGTVILDMALDGHHGMMILGALHLGADPALAAVQVVFPEEEAHLVAVELVEVFKE